MPNFALTLEYDGTDFEGWQRQPAGHRSVQGVLEAALADLAGHEVTVRGAGRTDAGVHAAGQLAAAWLELALEPEQLLPAINARMPDDLAVRRVERAAPGWNPRFRRGWKHYRYQIWNGRVPSPLRSRRFAHVRRRLALPAMAEAAALLVGRHDFAAFQGRGASVTCTERSLLELRVSGEEGAEVRLDARGDGFLKHMVRNLAGTLIEVGLGQRDPASMGALLESRDRRQAGRTAPAQGLVLVEVRVPIDPEPGVEEAPGSPRGEIA